MGKCIVTLKHATIDFRKILPQWTEPPACQVMLNSAFPCQMADGKVMMRIYSWQGVLSIVVKIF